MGKRDASHFITEYYTECGKVELMIPTDATDDDFALLKDILALVEAKMKQRADRKTEPTSSKMEQVDKDINVRSKEPQTVVRLKRFKCPKCGRSDYIRSFEDWGIDGGIYKYKCINCNTYIKDEPQTERSK